MKILKDSANFQYMHYFFVRNVAYIKYMHYICKRKMKLCDMTRYILKILLTQPIIVFSWGFNTLTAITNGLRFKVQGFKFYGTVEIVYNECTDLFDVKLIKNGNVVELIEGVYLDSLVDVIDNRVEMVDDYKQRVQKSL